MKLVVDLLDKESVGGAIKILSSIVFGDCQEQASVLGEIGDLELSTRSWNCLKQAGIMTIDQLVEKTASDLFKGPNFGKKCLREVESVLAERGLKLKRD
jgi:DNA-directed RNA polymerase alpha subunit